MQEEAHQPLKGLRVIDFSSMMAGPYCGRWLADMGADVIKIESPEGDYMRGRPPMHGAESSYFGHLNSGKRSIVLDLKNSDAVRVARALAKGADVLIEGFRPGVMQRLGLDYPTLLPECPHLIYCSVSGWGQDGPRAQQAAYASIVHAAVGFDMAWQAGQQGDGTPPNCVVQIADVIAASFAAMGIQAALIGRQSSGKGQYVDLALAEGMLALMPLEIMQAQFPSPATRTSYHPISASDAYFITTPLTQKNFTDLCVAIGRPQMLSDARFATSPERVRHWSEFMGEISDWAAGHTAAECVETLEAAGLPASLYGTVTSALSDPQLEARGFFRSVEDSTGQYRVAGLPFTLDGQQWAQQPAARIPRLGQHTYEVLRDVLGYGEDVIQEISGNGAFGAAGRLPA